AAAGGRRVRGARRARARIELADEHRAPCARRARDWRDRVVQRDAAVLVAADGVSARRRRGRGYRADQLGRQSRGLGGAVRGGVGGGAFGCLSSGPAPPRGARLFSGSGGAPRPPGKSPAPKGRGGKRGRGLLGERVKERGASAELSWKRARIAYRR